MDQKINEEGSTSRSDKALAAADWFKLNVLNSMTPSYAQVGRFA